MARGGKREGAGRKPGALTLRTREVADKVAETGITPLDYLLGIMRDDTQEQAVRIDVAKAAAPYAHPKLAAVDTSITGPDGGAVQLITRIELVAPAHDDSEG